MLTPKGARRTTSSCRRTSSSLAPGSCVLSPSHHQPWIRLILAPFASQNSGIVEDPKIRTLQVQVEDGKAKLVAARAARQAEAQQHTARIDELDGALQRKDKEREEVERSWQVKYEAAARASAQEDEAIRCVSLSPLRLSSSLLPFSESLTSCCTAGRRRPVTTPSSSACASRTTRCRSSSTTPARRPSARTSPTCPSSISCGSSPISMTSTPPRCRLSRRSSGGARASGRGRRSRRPCRPKRKGKGCRRRSRSFGLAS